VKDPPGLSTSAAAARFGKNRPIRTPTVYGLPSTTYDGVEPASDRCPPVRQEQLKLRLRAATVRTGPGHTRRGLCKAHLWQREGSVDQLTRGGGGEGVSRACAPVAGPLAKVRLTEADDAERWCFQHLVHVDETAPCSGQLAGRPRQQAGNLFGGRVVRSGLGHG
jgi:hypothetical protein